MRALDGLSAILTSRTDARTAAVCRIAAGAAAVIEMTAKGPLFVGVSVEGGHLWAPNFDWLPEPGPSGAMALVVISMVSAIGFSLGFLTRTCGVLLACSMGYWLALDQNLYSNHTYLLVLVTGLLVLADAGAALSIDRRLGWRRVSDIPIWPLTLIRVQISLMYLFAALAKLNPVFLSGEVLRSSSRVPAIVGSGYVLVLAAWTVVAWELFLAAALWSPRLRGIAFLGGLIFHILIVCLLERFPPPGLIAFGMVAVSCYLLFLDIGGGTLGAKTQRVG